MNPEALYFRFTTGQVARYSLPREARIVEISVSRGGTVHRVKDRHGTVLGTQVRRTGDLATALARDGLRTMWFLVPLVLAVMALLVAAALEARWPLFLAIGLVLASAGTALGIDIAGTRVRVVYRLAAPVQARFDRASEMVRTLSSSHIVRKVEGSRIDIDWKRTAGGGVQHFGYTAKTAWRSPPGIHTSLRVPMLRAGPYSLFFMPEGVWVSNRRKWSTASYGHVRTRVSTIETRERYAVPRDARVIRHVWEKVNRDGSRDKRFKENRQIPICEYAHLDLKVGGSNVGPFQMSNIAAATRVNQIISSWQIRTA